ncbi:hypothetical protein KKI23_04000, partial [Patescibacteria group bacterium]|nr:hypothetical protein [Patescibacteria group bacterium]
MDFQQPKDSNPVFQDSPPTAPSPPRQPSVSFKAPSSLLVSKTPEPKKSRKGLFILVGAFLGLAVILGGGYFAWDRGYISIPFLTPSIDEVIAASIEKLEALDQYSYEASLKIFAEDKNSEIEPIAISSDNEFAQYLEGNIRNEVDLLMSVEGVYRSRGDGKGDTELRYYGHSNYTDFEMPFEISLKVVEDIIYMKIDEVIKGWASVSEDWMKITADT